MKRFLIFAINSTVPFPKGIDSSELKITICKSMNEATHEDQQFNEFKAI